MRVDLIKTGKTIICVIATVTALSWMGARDVLALAPESSADVLESVLYTKRFQPYTTFAWELTKERRNAVDAMTSAHPAAAVTILSLLTSGDRVVREAGMHLTRKWGITDAGFRRAILDMMLLELAEDSEIPLDDAIEPALTLVYLSKYPELGVQEQIRMRCDSRNDAVRTAMVFALGYCPEPWALELLKHMYRTSLGRPFVYAVNFLDLSPEGKDFLAALEKDEKHDWRVRLARKHVIARDILATVTPEEIKPDEGSLAHGGNPDLLGMQMPAFATPHRKILAQKYEVLKKISSELRLRYPKEFAGIVAFGSIFKGYFKADSDLDFILVVRRGGRGLGSGIADTFRQLGRAEGLMLETRLPDFADVDYRLDDLLRPKGLSLPAVEDWAFSIPASEPEPQFPGELPDFFHGIFFGERSILEHAQRKILSEVSRRQWDEIRYDVAKAEQYIVIAFHRFRIKDMEQREGLRILAGLHRIPPPFEDACRILGLPVAGFSESMERGMSLDTEKSL